MTFRLGCGFLLTIMFFAAAPAEVVRFRTDVGNIDMVLNPANDPRLQKHVDNLIDYVEARRYHCTVINRAAGTRYYANNLRSSNDLYDHVDSSCGSDTRYGDFCRGGYNNFGND